jgi:hypothetical protein
MLSDGRRTRDFQPGDRVAWAPVIAGTVARRVSDSALVVDLDNGQTITSGEQLLVDITTPEAGPDAG